MSPARRYPLALRPASSAARAAAFSSPATARLRFADGMWPGSLEAAAQPSRVAQHWPPRHGLWRRLRRALRLLLERVAFDARSIAIGKPRPAAHKEPRPKALPTGRRSRPRPAPKPPRGLAVS